MGCVVGQATSQRLSGANRWRQTICGTLRRRSPRDRQCRNPELTQQLSIPRIRQAAGRAGFDTARIPGEDRRSSVVPAIQKLYGEMIPAQQLKLLPILASHMSAEIVNKLLRPHGYSLDRKS